MNTLELNVQELSYSEKSDVNGGNFWLALLGAIAYDAISNPQDCVNGFKAGLRA